MFVKVSSKSRCCYDAVTTNTNPHLLCTEFDENKFKKGKVPWRNIER